MSSILLTAVLNQKTVTRLSVRRQRVRKVWLCYFSCHLDLTEYDMFQKGKCPASQPYPFHYARKCCSKYYRAPGCTSGLKGTPLEIRDNPSCCPDNVECPGEATCKGPEDETGIFYSSLLFVGHISL